MSAGSPARANAKPKGKGARAAGGAAPLLAVTGSGGFIGLRMAERARERGMRVRGLELGAEAARRAEAQGFETIVGDVNDSDAVRRLCAGASVVFHTAAIVDEGGEWARFREVNVEGTRHVASVARDAGVRRFVHLSSVMVYGFDFPRFVSEAGPFRGEGNPYCQTKIESEEALRALHRPGSFETIVIRPGDVYGPGSVPWVIRPVELMKRGLFMLIDGGRGIMNHVHVDNLIDGIFAALDRDVTGEAFNLTDGAETSFREYFTRLGALVGRKRFPSLPRPVAIAAFGAMARGARLLGRKPLAEPSAVPFVTRPHTYSIEKARSWLGYQPKVTLDEGMRELAAWLETR